MSLKIGQYLMKLWHTKICANVWATLYITVPFSNQQHVLADWYARPPSFALMPRNSYVVCGNMLTVTDRICAITSKQWCCTGVGIHRTRTHCSL